MTTRQAILIARSADAVAACWATLAAIQPAPKLRWVQNAESAASKAELRWKMVQRRIGR